MKFLPDKVVSRSEFEELIYKELGIEKSEIKDSVQAGNILVSSVKQAIVSYMNLYVSRMDKILEVYNSVADKKHDNKYLFMFSRRGFTFKEYFFLFDGNIKEEDYKHFPIFNFLKLRTAVDRRLYTVNSTTDVESYVELLLSLSVPEKGFFLRELSSLIPYSKLKKHAYIVGGTGSGKSELMKLMIYNLQKQSQKKQNKAIILIDPHGDLAKEIRDFHLNAFDKEEAYKRMVYLEPDLIKGYTFTLNPFQVSLKKDPEKTIKVVTEQLVSVFEEIVPRATLSNYMKAIVAPCIATLLRKGNSSLLDLQRFMDDDNNQDLVELGKQSPIISHKIFFQNSFYKKDYNKTKTSLSTKLQTLLNSKTFYDIAVGKSTVDFEKCINQGKIIVFNLSKGEIGVDASVAFGKMIIATLQGIAMRRASVQERYRKPTFLFVDECHNYITGSISTLLSETRKYAVHAILANQILGQEMSEGIKQNLLSNTEIKMIGSCDASTMKAMAATTGIDKKQLESTKNYHFVVKHRTGQHHTIKTTPMLKNKKYKLSKEDRKKLIDYLVNESGYYKKIDGDKIDPTRTKSNKWNPDLDSDSTVYKPIDV